MAWLSILPAYLTSIETWLVRIFLLLGILTIGPWAILVIYDIVLYMFRSLMYEVPVVGGRARGRQRPRAPSLTERPSGRPRGFSISKPITNENEADTKEGLRYRTNEDRHHDQKNAHWEAQAESK